MRRDFLFSKDRLKNLKPESVSITYGDKRTPGLYCRVSPKGKMTYFVRRRLPGGESVRHVIHRGTVGPEALEGAIRTADELRQAATAALQALSKGDRPGEQIRGASTFGALIRRHVDHRMAGKKSQPQLQALQRRHLPDRAQLRQLHAEYAEFKRCQDAGERLPRRGKAYPPTAAAEIAAALMAKRAPLVKAHDIERLHEAITKESGPVVGNRVYALLRRAINLAIEKRDFIGENPAAAIKRNKERPRHNFVPESEIPKLLAAMAKEGEPWADFFQVLLLTGSRKATALSMEGKEIDLEGRRWTIPAAKRKGERDHDMVVPLLPELVEILSRRKRLADDSPWVFPSGRTDGPIANPRPAWVRIRERAGMPHLRVHDLRHSHASLLINSGVSLALVGKALGHASPRSTETYSHVEQTAVEQAQQQSWGKVLRKKGS